MTILLITFEDDAHLKPVLAALTEKEVFPVCYNWGHFPGESSIHMSIKSGRTLGFTIHHDGRTINSDEITAVWYRRPTKPYSSSQSNPSIRQYIENESQMLLENLYHALPHALWISIPDNEIRAKRKPYQLSLADQIGFKIPDSCIGNDEQAVEEFISRYPQLILKTIDRPSLVLNLNWIEKIKRFIYHFRNQNVRRSYPENHPRRGLVEYRHQVIMHSRLVTPDDIRPTLKAVSNCPVIFQEYIPKKLELRITVVGNQVFPCAIYSQESNVPENKVDCRHDLFACRHEVFPLPSDINLMCIQLVQELGLQFGTIDMIVTPDDEYVFLEINPCGQWLWVEEMTGLPISEAIAELLCSTTQEVNRSS